MGDVQATSCPLFIEVPRDLQEMFPYFSEILCKYKTAYSLIHICIFIIRKHRNAFYRLFQYLLYPHSNAWNEVTEAFFYPLNRHWNE